MKMRTEVRRGRPMGRTWIAAAALAVAVGLGSSTAQASLQASAPALQQARRDLGVMRAMVENELRNSPDLADAKQRLADARQAWLDAERNTLEPLLTNTSYLVLREKQSALQAELDALYLEFRNGVVPMDQVRKLSLQIMDVRSEMSEMEALILLRSNQAETARADYLSALSEYVNLRRDAIVNSATNPRVVSLRQAYNRLRYGS